MKFARIKSGCFTLFKSSQIVAAVAERKRFELLVPFRAHTISKLVNGYLRLLVALEKWLIWPLYLVDFGVNWIEKVAPGGKRGAI